MRRTTLYTLGRPQAELEAMRQLIAKERAIDTRGQHIYVIKKDYGRVFYALVNEKTETGLLLVMGPEGYNRTHYHGGSNVELSEWEAQDMFKLARKLSLYKFRMLPALRVFEDEITALVQGVASNEKC